MKEKFFLWLFPVVIGGAIGLVTQTVTPTKSQPAGGDVFMASTNATDVTNAFIPSNIYRDQTSIVWEYDWIRENNRLEKEDQERAKQFVATNTNPRVIATLPYRFTSDLHELSSIHEPTRELGYRSDGVVVWRWLPEKAAK